MARSTKPQEVADDASVTPARRFDARDLDIIAEMAVDELQTRQTDRRDLEKQWADIDRQIAMQPNIAHKRLPNGSIDPKKAWMSEIELPLQAQALEILNSDARRFMFPDTGNFFRAHAHCTDDYFDRVNFQSIILGDQTEVPSHINQDNADKLVEGFLAHQFNQMDFTTRVARINAEAFKYSMGVGRARMETKSVYIDEAKGVRKETQQLPVLVPCSIKNTYLDTPKPSMHSAQVLGPMQISVDWMKFANLAVAANKGSSDPNDMDGGWMPANLKKLEPDDKGYVKLIELEGDIVVPRKTVRSLVIPGAIVTIAVGASRAVVRLRYRKYPFSSYLLFPYHYESADAAYPTSPLMKGRPVQIMATEALNRLMDSAALKNAPPVGWDKSDVTLAQMGGPHVEPYVLWPTIDAQAIKVFSEVGGDPAAMASILNNALTLYADLVGILPGRLGAQTVSHTTAYAKDAELQRGAVRTINYTNQSGNGPMLRWLDMAYRMGRDSLGKSEKIAFFIEAYGGFVEVTKDQLPDEASFDWLGSGGPQDNNQKLQNMTNSLLLASKLDQLNVAMGKPPRININGAIDQVLRSGGWIDLDSVTNGDANLAGAQVGPGPAVAAVQNLALPQPQ